ncbi:DNA ligase [Rheinheimera metallidurans]|uniref:DNA ligase n=1 Tax=Rheinheimera metallidurans TaxID=2925781 RepID=UPI003002E884
MNKLLLLVLLLGSFSLAAATKPDLILAEVYNDTFDVRQYWVSEKLDGVRAYWDGKQLISRGGHIIAAPTWFTAHFPNTALDGELWLGQQRFADTLSSISNNSPVDSEWQKLGYYVFELPNGAGSFTERLSQLQAIVAEQNSAYLHVIPQFRVADKEQLIKKLAELENIGAEGLMLHHQDALYKTGRTTDLLKLKSYLDTEATVIGYRPGKGKYQGMVGALLVKNAAGQEFAIGSGLTDALRKNPPAIGSTITYRYNGLTKHGLPRFARFLRIYTAF